MPEAFLVGGVRTPQGRYGGALAGVRADDLVTGRERDQVGEALERDRVAVVHVFGDRVAEGQLRGSGHVGRAGRYQ